MGRGVASRTRFGRKRTLSDPPPAVFAADWFGLLPWPIFLALRTLFLGAVLTMPVVGPAAAVLALLYPVTVELGAGNIHILLGAALVLAPRHPWAMALPSLTKPTLGVGLLWFVARREWRLLAQALIVTGLIAGLTFAIAPSLWFDWSSVLPTPAAELGIAVPLWLRPPVAAALVVYGARRGWEWVLPVAGCIALPVLWVAGLTMGLIGLARALRLHDLQAESPQVGIGRIRRTLGVGRGPAEAVASVSTLKVTRSITCARLPAQIIELRPQSRLPAPSRIESHAANASRQSDPQSEHRGNALP